MGVSEHCEVCDRVRDALAGANVGQDEGLPFDVAVLNAAWEEMHREAKQCRRAVAALHEAIKLARDFNRGAMTWQEYDRKLAALEASRSGYDFVSRQRDEFQRERNEARAEVERLNREGVPGVMHKIDEAFYDLTVKERNRERVRCNRLEAELTALRTEVERLTAERDKYRRLFNDCADARKAARESERHPTDNEWKAIEAARTGACHAT